MKKIIKLSLFAAGIAFLASCGSTNQVASHFGKRKYMKGFYLNTSSKGKEVAANKTTHVIHRASTATAPVIASNAGNTTQQRNVPSITQASTPVITASNKAAVATNKTPQVRTAFSGVVPSKKAIAAANKSHEESTSTAKVSSTKSMAHTAMGGGSCKNWMVALILCALVGGLGIHRFYLGYIWQGVVQLLTGGACGVWTLIDFIRIIMKTLKPKNGSYCN